VEVDPNCPVADYFRDGVMKCRAMWHNILGRSEILWHRRDIMQCPVNGVLVLYWTSSASRDRVSSVGIATHYGVDGPGIEFR
jgi:hypothetical protein